MKKTVFVIIACAALTAACNNGKKASNTTDAQADTTATADSIVYEGVRPAADCAGIRYRLAVANDSTQGFSLTESYLKSETEVENTYAYAGKLEEQKATVGGKENTYYKLPMGKNEPTTNFLVVNDSTLRLVNDQLEEAATKELNYDLKLVK